MSETPVCTIRGSPFMSQIAYVRYRLSSPKKEKPIDHSQIIHSWLPTSPKSHYLKNKRKGKYHARNSSLYENGITIHESDCLCALSFVISEERETDWPFHLVLPDTGLPISCRMRNRTLTLRDREALSRRRVIGLCIALVRSVRAPLGASWQGFRYLAA
eukprot:gene18877-biopygen701